MKQRMLGHTGLSVGEISLGTWALGCDVYGDASSLDAERLVQGAIDAGINLFDTAPLYGSATEVGVSESVLGRALGSSSDRVLISTKFGRTSTQVFPPRFDSAEARRSVDDSLRRLRRSHIDVLFFHSPFSPDEINDDVWEALDALRGQGKIRHIGHSVSEYRATAGMCSEWMRQRKIGVIQIVMSLFNREARELALTAADLGVGVVARECLANGFLSGTVTRDTTFTPGTLNARYSREEIALRAEYAESLGSIMVRDGVSSLPHAAYRWVLDQTGVSTALSGARSLEELRDPLLAAEADPFPRDVLDSVETRHARDFSAA